VYLALVVLAGWGVAQLVRSETVRSAEAQTHATDLTPAQADHIRRRLWLPELNDEKLDRFLAYVREMNGLAGVTPAQVMAEATMVARKHGFELAEALQLQLVFGSYVMKLNLGQVDRAHTEALEWYGTDKAAFIFRNEGKLKRAFAGEPEPAAPNPDAG
jgi:hypothetical protein